MSEGEYVYEWRHGEDTGVRFKKNDRDLIDYILYLTDPSYIMTSLYYESQSKPDKYEVKDHKPLPYKEFLAKKSAYGFEAVLVDTDSLWFHGFRLRSPQSNESSTFYIDTPVKFKAIPQKILKEMKSVKFEDSDYSVKRHMVYL